MCLRVRGARCRVTMRVRGERGGTTGVLNQRAGDRRGEERDRPAYVWAKKRAGTRPVNIEDTSGARDGAKDTNICIFTNKYRTREQLQPIRPAETDADACSSTRSRYTMEVLPEAHGRSSKQREPPENLQKRKLWRMDRGEAFGSGPTTLRPP